METAIKALKPFNKQFIKDNKDKQLKTEVKEIQSKLLRSKSHSEILIPCFNQVKFVNQWAHPKKVLLSQTTKQLISKHKLVKHFRHNYSQSSNFTNSHKDI